MRRGETLMHLGLRHLRESRRTIVIVGLAALVPLVAAIVVGRLTGTNFSFFTRDPLAVAKAPVYLGFVSNLGVMIWTAGAVLALFGGYRMHTGTRLGRLLVGAGWLSLLLAVDDMFMLHDVLHIDHGFDVTYAYFGIAAFGIWHYRLVLIEQTNFPLFLLAFGGLGMSAGIDTVFHALGLDYLPGSSFIEDAFKFVGICFWAAFAWREAARAPMPVAAPVSTPMPVSVPVPVPVPLRTAAASARPVTPAEQARKTAAPQ